MAVEISEQAVQVELNVMKVSAQTILSAIQWLLANQRTVTHGQQSLRKLNLQGRQLESIPVAGADLNAIRRELRQYSVDYSLMRDRNTGEYSVFFKSQDVERVYSGLKEFAKDWENRKRPMKEVMEEAQRSAEERNRKETKTQERTQKREKAAR